MYKRQSKNSVVREKIQFLRECISDHGFIIEDLAYDKEEINEKNEEIEEKNGRIEKWANQIVQKGKMQCEMSGDIENGLYVPHFIKKLQTILKLFPLWSNISNKFFNISHNLSSSSSEAYFSFLKGDVFSNPMRLDDFFLKHSALIDGDMKVNKGSVLKCSKEIVTENQHLFEEETWEKRAKGKNYLLPHPEIKLVNEKNKSSA